MAYSVWYVRAVLVPTCGTKIASVVEPQLQRKTARRHDHKPTETHRNNDTHWSSIGGNKGALLLCCCLVLLVLLVLLRVRVWVLWGLLCMLDTAEIHPAFRLSCRPCWL